jgi:hypothetical protein
MAKHDQQKPDEPTLSPAPVEADEQPAAKPRRFRLRHDIGAHRVSLGAAPRISLAAGDTYQTTDERLAARLATHPDLEEEL